MDNTLTPIHIVYDNYTTRSPNPNYPNVNHMSHKWISVFHVYSMRLECFLFPECETPNAWPEINCNAYSGLCRYHSCIYEMEKAQYNLKLAGYIAIPRKRIIPKEFILENQDQIFSTMLSIE